MTKLDELLDEAVRIRERMRELDDPMNRKLTADAFRQDALRLARTTEARLSQLDDILGDTSMASVASFVRKVARELAAPNWTALPSDLTRMSRVYGSEDAERQLADAGFRISEAVALATFKATEQYRDAFGKVEDADLLPDLSPFIN